MKSKFTPKIALIATAFMLFSFSSFSQLTREFHVSKIDNTLSDTVTFNLWGMNLSNIADFQFSLNWDTTQLTYLGYTLPTTNFGLTGGDLSYKHPKAGTSIGGLGFAHIDLTLLGQSVPDSTILTTIKFKFTNGYSKNVIDSVIFGNYPTAIAPIDTTDGNYGAPGNVPESLIGGYVSTPFLPTIAHGSNGVLIASTGATVPPTSYQWYTVTCAAPCGPGAAVVYTAISGATSSQINSAKGVTYSVVAIYANGADRDTAVNTVLPVKLINFNGKTKDRANLLSWNISNENGVSSYVIERSNDGTNFTEIGTVKALGNNGYSFTDANLNASFSYYYRLRMEDAIGNFAYSTVVKLNKQGKLVFQVQPNPIENSTINIYGNNMKQAKIYDSFGRLLLNTVVNADQASIKMNNLTKGVYMINIVSADGISQTEKFLVK